MKSKNRKSGIFCTSRLAAGGIFTSIGIASWSNAQYWANYYLRIGISPSVADYISFSQRISLIPAFVIPLMMFLHGSRYRGIRAKRNLYRYPSRSNYWYKLCCDAMWESLLASLVLTIFSILPAFLKSAPISFINWKTPYSLFALMSGSSLRENPAPLQILGAYWATAWIQIFGSLLLYAIAECRLKPFFSFVLLLIADLGLNSANHQSLWDHISLRYGMWEKPFGIGYLIAGWVTFLIVLFFIGKLTYRKADIL